MHQIEYRNKNEYFLKAVNEQNAAKVKTFLQGEVDVNYKDEKGGFTALMRACLLGNKEIVKLILKNRPIIDIQNNLNKTALMVIFLFVL